MGGGREEKGRCLVCRLPLGVVQARTELARALDLAHRLGARRIAAQAHTELTATSAKPRREAITGRDAPTAGDDDTVRLWNPASGQLTRDNEHSVLRAKSGVGG